MKPVLQKGSNGPDVVEVQGRLNNFHVFRVGGQHYPPLVTDGLYGDRTEQRVREFQQISHLKVDGIVGNQTWAALIASTPAWVKPGATHPNPAPRPGALPRPGRTIQLGYSGPDVMEAQFRLNGYFGVYRPPYTRPTPHGIFDLNTKRHVIEFQTYESLSADGIIGPRTWSELIAKGPLPAGMLPGVLPPMPRGPTPPSPAPRLP